MMILFCTLPLLFAVVTGKRKPHVLMLVMDDVGFYDTEIYGESNIPTPNMVNLIKNHGIRLDHFHTQQVCSPTRSSLLTGFFPFRMGLQHSTTLSPSSRGHIPLDVKTVPEILKSHGYSTNLIGKWHLGYAKQKYTPLGRGFDTAVGYYNGEEDYYTKTRAYNYLGREWGGYDFHRNGNVDYSAAGEYSLYQYMEEYENLLDHYNKTHATAGDKNEEPLFLYFAFQTVHIPLQLGKKERGCAGIKNYWRRVYCSMMIELDDAMKQVVDLLQKYDMWDDSLVLVCSDNGGMVKFQPLDPVTGELPFPSSVGSNFPLRGSKGNLYEGGVRATSFILGGKNIIPAANRGTTYNGLMHVVDFAAIAVGMSGYDMGEVGNEMDGMDIFSSILKPNDGLERQHIPLNINYFGVDFTAIRFGKYKLIVGDGALLDNDGWYGKNGIDRVEAPKREGRYSLFDLETDPYEKNNIAKDNKKVIHEGLQLIYSYMKTGYRSPQINQAHVKGLPSASNNFTWKPFLEDHEHQDVYLTLEHEGVEHFGNVFESIYV